MAEFQWPEIVEQNISTGILLEVGAIITLYAPIGDEPGGYPSHPYAITQIIDKSPGNYRVKLRRIGP